MSWWNPFSYVEKGVKAVGNGIGQAGKCLVQGGANIVGGGVGYLHEGTGNNLLIQEMRSKKVGSTQEMLSTPDTRLWGI